MNTQSGFVFSALLGLALLFSATSDVFAARMGGGRSFGGRPSYNMPYQRPPGMANPGASRPAAPPQQPAYSAAQQRNQAARESLAQRGGLTRFLGGMALGGLLGALFFGGGFEHINFLDILIFGGIAFLLFRLLAARRQGAERVVTPGGGYSGSMDADPVYGRQSSAPSSGSVGFDTDILSRKTGAGADLASNDTIAVPSDFDAPAFLSGAKAAYRMMQKAWDQGDLADLRGLATDKVFAELQDQIRARGDAPNQTEVLKIETELLEVRDIGPDREATVLFDVLMREASDDRPSQVREVWHFTRPRHSSQPTWFLDGIQQLED